MITVKICGGLGNQMFQYATAKALALYNNTDLILDITSYNDPNRPYPYPYVLDKFNLVHINVDAPDSELITERYYHHDIDMLIRFDKNVTLNGYWQAEEYFKLYRNIILREFTLKEKYRTCEVTQMERYISRTKYPIFLHVRRDERAHEANAKKIYGLIPAEFYIKAIGMMKQWFPEALLIGVSDDYQWLEKEFRDLLDTTFEEFTDYQTMHLMSMCKHGIIANSSFSWWGAWLMNNPDKIIIAPEQWTIDPDKSNVNIVPAEWIKIKTEYL